MKTLGDFNAYVSNLEDEDASLVLLAVMYVVQYLEYASLEVELTNDQFINLRYILLNKLNPEEDISPDSKERKRLTDLAMTHINIVEKKWERLPAVIA